jgi:topoisomerase IA-like protein
VTEFVLRFPERIVQEIPSIQVFGQEKDKLVLQPTGMACIEFLTQYFGDLFAYDYTQRMEAQLDDIATGNVPDGFDMCRQCAEDIDRLSAPVLDMGKMIFPMADCSDNVLVFQPHGVSIRRTDPVDQSMTYMPVNSSNLDLERARDGKYTTSELLHVKEHCLGQHEGHNVILKQGRYGSYLAWNGKKVPARDPDLGLENAVALLQHRAPPIAPGVLRIINTDCSVREGKFGPYLFYKTSEMKTPTFYSLRGLEWKTTSDDALLKWLHEQHQPKKKKKFP